MKVKKVTSLKDAMIMREIRNECRDFMTNDQSYIGAGRQLWWYIRYAITPYLKAYLYYYKGEPFGFGLVRGNIITGGLKEKYRGKGLGEQLFKDLCERTENMTWLNVFADNIPAYTLYKKIGFKEYEKRHGLIIMYKI